MLENISPEEKSYIIGFLQGDGSSQEQSRNRGKIRIELSNKDKDILDKIENLLNEVNIYRKNRIRDTNFKDNFSSSILSIYNLEFRAKIKPYLSVGKKSDIIKPPTDMVDFNKYSYLRGLTDADGSIGITSLNRPFWSICVSSEEIKTFIINDIKNVLDFDKRLNRNKRDNVYNIVLFDEDAIKYTKLLYNDSTIHLDRKYKKYNDIQNWVRSIPKSSGRKKSWLNYEDTVVLNGELSLKDKCILLKRTEQSIKTRLWRLKQA